MALPGKPDARVLLSEGQVHYIRSAGKKQELFSIVVVLRQIGRRAGSKKPEYEKNREWKMKGLEKNS